MPSPWPPAAADSTAATRLVVRPVDVVRSAGATDVADGTLTIGTLLPQTGSLAFLGPPEFAGVDLAIKEINAAGGVLGKPVVKYRRRLR